MKSYRIFINEHEVIELIATGDQTIISTEAMADEIEGLVQQRHAEGKRGIVLYNLVEVGTVPPEARLVVVKKARASTSDKMAVYGNSRKHLIGINLIIRAIHRSDRVKYFEDYGEAIAWLKSE